MVQDVLLPLSHRSLRRGLVAAALRRLCLGVRRSHRGYHPHPRPQRVKLRLHALAHLLHARVVGAKAQVRPRAHPAHRVRLILQRLLLVHEPYRVEHDVPVARGDEVIGHPPNVPLERFDLRIVRVRVDVSLKNRRELDRQPPHAPLLQQPALVLGQIRPRRRERRELQPAHETLHLVAAEEHREKSAGVDEGVVLEAVLAPLVVLFAQRLVAEHLIRLADALKLLVRLRVVGILIRVKFPGEEVIRALDLRGGGGWGDLEGVVVLGGRDAAAVYRRASSSEGTLQARSLAAGLGAFPRLLQDVLVGALRESERFLDEILGDPDASVRVPSLPRVGLHDGFRGIVSAPRDLRDADGGARDG